MEKLPLSLHKRFDVDQPLRKGDIRLIVIGLLTHLAMFALCPLFSLGTPCPRRGPLRIMKITKVTPRVSVRIAVKWDKLPASPYRRIISQLHAFTRKKFSAFSGR